MGGGISIIKTAEDARIKKLVTFASIANFHNLWPKEVEAQWRLSGILYMPNKRTGQNMPLKASLLADLDNHFERLDILAKASQIKQPWLIVHGDADPTVPLNQAEALEEAQPNAEFLVIEGGDHVLARRTPTPMILYLHPYQNFVMPQLHFLTFKFRKKYSKHLAGFLINNEA